MPVRPNDLQEFATDLLISGGFRAEHATDTARILVWADKRGTHSHGVLRIPRYVEMVRTGIINPDATLAETLPKVLSP